MKYWLAFMALGQTGYESMNAGERFLYHEITKKITVLEEKMSRATRRQVDMKVRIGETAVRVGALKEELDRRRKEVDAMHVRRKKEIDALNAFRDNSLGRRTVEMGGVAGGTGLIIALANYLLNRRLATKGGRNGSRG